VKASEKVREKISFLTNDIKLDPQFSPKYMFNFFGRLHGLEEKAINERRSKLFDYFGIRDFEDKKIEELSTGMKQKASIAVSLAHDPEVVIFDEPTNGLDIVTARSVTDYLRLLKEEGKTVIISTHIMSEAEKLCDRIGIIINGVLVMEGTVPEILSKTNTTELEDAFFELYKLHNNEEA
jgi:sodium transport system ATP-binding protein